MVVDRSKCLGVLPLICWLACGAQTDPGTLADEIPITDIRSLPAELRLLPERGTVVVVILGAPHDDGRVQIFLVDVERQAILAATEGDRGAGRESLLLRIDREVQARRTDPAGVVSVSYCAPVGRLGPDGAPEETTRGLVLRWAAERASRGPDACSGAPGSESEPADEKLRSLLGLTLTSGSGEALEEYARKCDAAIGVSVRDFQCDAGTLVPTTHFSGGVYPDGTCDRPNRLNKACDSGKHSRLTSYVKLWAIVRGPYARRG